MDRLRFPPLLRDPAANRGMSLVELVVGVAFLGIAASVLLSYLSQTYRAQGESVRDSWVLEAEEVVRAELGLILQTWQKRITESQPSTQCVNGYADFLGTQNSTARSGMLFFGLPSGANTYFGGSLNGVLTALRTDVTSGTAARDPLAGTFIDALNRCATTQTFAAPNQNLRTRNSVYFCGYGMLTGNGRMGGDSTVGTDAGYLIEARTAFWDFVGDRPIACASMNEVPGRGGHALYKLYAFRRLAGGGGFHLSAHSGRLYVVKNLRD